MECGIRSVFALDREIRMHSEIIGSVTSLAKKCCIDCLYRRVMNYSSSSSHPKTFATYLDWPTSTCPPCRNSSHPMSGCHFTGPYQPSVTMYTWPAAEGNISSCSSAVSSLDWCRPSVRCVLSKLGLSSPHGDGQLEALVVMDEDITFIWTTSTAYFAFSLLFSNGGDL
jgi:hypothetical protein